MHAIEIHIICNVEFICLMMMIDLLGFNLFKLQISFIVI